MGWTKRANFADDIHWESDSSSASYGHVLEEALIGFTKLNTQIKLMFLGSILSPS
jgi:hypothetical protein